MRPEGPLFRFGVRMVVAAHPDDETIGMGGMLPQLPDPLIVHVTDGAPADEADAHAAGFATREEYARARRAELLHALALAGIGGEHALEIGLTDQQASLHLAGTARRLAELFDHWRPAVVFTHPYEGGHPDHDATAFAVHAAAQIAAWPPAIVEFASYHERNGEMETGRFLEDGPQVVENVLDEAARRRKREMLDCFKTQRQTLGCFKVDTECFRRAPDYDFTRPPHAGTLWYERFPWGLTGERFRALASEALEALGLGMRT